MKIKFRTIIVFLIIILSVVYISLYFNIKNTVYASNQELQENIKIYEKNTNVENINLIEIINNNKELQNQDIIVEEEEIEYNTLYRQNADLEKGKMQVKREGKNGLRKIVVKKINEDEKQILASKIIKPEITKIVEIGTKEKIIQEKITITNNVGLSKNINLAKPSGLTNEQFEKILSNNTQDKNQVLKNNAKYFYYAEHQYGINGVFLAAVAIHESSWGTSKISIDKKNLFGYGAYDNSAYKSSYEFSSYEEGIDLLARVFMKYYLNPKGTKIYENEIAEGKYYNGNTLDAVNVKYASDKNWSEKVYNWMQYLYNRL